RSDVVVVVEDVLGVDRAFHLAEPLEVRPVRGPHRVLALVVGEVVEPLRLREMRFSAACVSRTHATLASVSFGSNQVPGMTRFQPSARCGTAVSVAPTRHTAPWKCSSSRTVPSDGTVA